MKICVCTYVCVQARSLLIWQQIHIIHAPRQGKVSIHMNMLMIFCDKVMFSVCVVP